MTKTTILLLAVLTLAACNTFQGMGEDIKSAGEAINNTASKAKDKM